MIVDVAVIGGGVAGMSAAISSARQGARTVLLEKMPVLGGVSRAGVRFPVCGLFDCNGVLLNEGLSRDVFEKSGCDPERVGRVWILPFELVKLSCIFREWMDAEVNLNVMVSSAVSGVELSGNRISGIKCNDDLIKVGAVVDCSGEGVAAGAVESGAIMPADGVLAGFCLRFDGVIPDPVLSLKVGYVLRKQFPDSNLRFSVFMKPDCIKLALPVGVTSEELNSSIDSVVTVLKRELASFRDAEICERSTCIMRREGVRMRGCYVLTGKDILECVSFEDVVVRSAWPLEFWHEGRGQYLEYPVGNGVADIPLRCLKSSKIENLFAAGQSISAMSDALSAVRVAGTCIATGEVAGLVAAAYCGISNAKCL